MNLQDLIDDAKDKQALYELQRRKWGEEIGRPVKRLRSRSKPEPGTLDSEEVEG